jgi:hypothetical protein
MLECAALNPCRDQNVGARASTFGRALASVWVLALAGPSPGVARAEAPTAPPYLSPEVHADRTETAPLLFR